MDQPSKFTPVIISTAIMTFISALPGLNLVNLLCCGGIIIGAFAGTAFYAKKLKAIGSAVQFKDGAAIGVFSGILTALLVTIFNTLFTMLSSQNPVPEVYKIIDQFGYTLPPEAEKLLKQVSDEYNKHGFSITITIINLVADLIFFPLFGFLGGILASSVFGKRRMSQQVLSSDRHAI
jgi:hypothetical protein